jgi:hypothetical protein
MITSAAVPVEEYLQTTYHPDKEYVGGQLVERNVGEHDHCLLQSLLVIEWAQGSVSGGFGYSRNNAFA